MHDVPIGSNIMDVNDRLAAENRSYFDKNSVYAVNLMSAPGAGKTSILEETIKRIKNAFRIGVIEGDLVTTIDADRITALGVPAHQITTGSVCHLDARMVHNALHKFDIADLDLLVVENVGNLVCPAEFDVGEHLKVMVFSTVEGAEKPKKYPLMFHEADAVILNKIDLLPYAGVSFDELAANVRDVNPDAPIFPVSCRTGEGIDAWVEWLRSRIEPAALRSAAH
jgi:hydrogenase nickel incorporation protein HypB